MPSKKSRVAHLVLHGGLPKTATKALQAWCTEQSAFLKRHGVTWGKFSGTLLNSKHQWLVRSFMTGDFSLLERELEESETPILLLSTEGLTNHILDFPPAAMSAFRKVLGSIRLSFFVTLRERESWALSYWKQMVLNAPSPDGYYGAVEPLSEYRRKPRPALLEHHDRLIGMIQETFAPDEVIVASYEKGPLMPLLTSVGISRESSDTVRGLRPSNVSVSDDLIELVRQINAQKLPLQERAAALSLLGDVLPSDIGLRQMYPLTLDATALDATGAACRVLQSLDAHTEEQRDLISRAVQQVMGIL